MHHRLPPVIALFFCLVSVVSAQDDCPTLVSDALAAVADRCTELGRNQACYANVALQATPYPDALDFRFEAPGDTAALGSMQSLTLSSRLTESGEWGIALLSVQANLPDTLPGQNVTMLLFGQVTLESALPYQAEIPVTASGSVRVRLAPLTDPNNAVFMTLSDGQTVIADARNEDRSWLRVRVDHPDYPTGWVSAELVRAEQDLALLPVIAPRETLTTPLSAFVLSSGVGDRPCAEAPDSGILIQTPDGAASAAMTINGAQVIFGSSVYVQAQPGGVMTIALVEGRALVAAAGSSVIVPTGAQITVPLDAAGIASGPPSAPQPYDASALSALPTGILPRSVDIAPPATDIDAALDAMLPFTGTWRGQGRLLDSTCTSTDPSLNGPAELALTFEPGRVTLADSPTLTETSPGVYSGSVNVSGDGLLPATISYTLTLTSSTSAEVIREVAGECVTRQQLDLALP